MSYDPPFTDDHVALERIRLAADDVMVLALWFMDRPAETMTVRHVLQQLRVLTGCAERLEELIMIEIRKTVVPRGE